ncbi:peptidylprolyl isomerase [Dyadobacter tibetensis]|uniref:peptidylprolyl isomerase n=1 Tax=Dyadobacter tibetensis TaxID=1211851 RepID=UPI00047169BB|nr:peptidylprolyl isomerase [Dyadobacter tibetensis]
MLGKTSLYISVSLIALYSCKKPVSVPQAITQKVPVLQIGEEEVTAEEFNTAYQNYKKSEDSLLNLTPDEYVPIYTERRLKVKQAQASGKDTTTDYQEQVASYRIQLAKSHVKDRSLVDQLAKEAYERMKLEVKASHILIPVSWHASPADTLQAYRAALAMKGRLEEGEDFEKMAVRFSKDPTAPQNRGNLGYFTAFQMIYPLETAAYTTPIGKISSPVRSRSGYHILKVNDRRPNRGLVQVAHIMIKSDSLDSETKKEIVKAQIFEAYRKLSEGSAWDNVLREYTDDKNSIANNGILPMFGVGQMVPEIEDAAYALTKTGSYSQPVKSIYGWHILRLESKKPLESYENLLASLRQRVVTDTRGQVFEQARAQRLRQQYKPVEYADNWKQALSLADSSLLTANWSENRAVSNNWNNTALFSIAQTPYPAQGFFGYVKRKQFPSEVGSSPAVVFRHLYESYLTEKLSEYEIAHLEEIDNNFKMEMDRVKEGILLSQIMEEQVWQRSLSDSLGQVAWYNQHQDKYKFPERAFGKIIIAPDQNTLKQVQDILEQKPYVLSRKTPELLFTASSAQLDADHEVALKELLVLLKSNPNYLVEVAGYRTATEPEPTSSSRIRNVVNYLTKNQIPIIRIIEKDYGSYRPSASEERNRRVSFQLFSNSSKDIEMVLNEDQDIGVQIEEGYFTKTNALLQGVEWKKGIQSISTPEGKKYVEIDRIEMPRPKKFMEARGSVINDFQKELEKNWMSNLKSRYPVKVNEEELQKIAP